MPPGIIGAIIGLLGTLISRWADIKDKHAEDATQLELARSNERIAAMELEKEKVRARAEENAANIAAQSRADEANAKAEAAIMAASYTHDSNLSYEDGSKIGQFIRGIIRPTLTIVYSATFLWVVWYATTPAIIVSEAPALFAAFIEVAVAVTLWWFGIRKGYSK